MELNELASEVKCYTLTTQNPIAGTSPMKMIAAKPQSTNASDIAFNKRVMEEVERCADLHLLSTAADGLAADSQFLTDGLVSFLVGESNVVHLVDPNHVGKAVRSQMIVGSEMKFVGVHLVDPGLLVRAGVEKSVYCVDDYTSDLLVLKLCSVSTLQKLIAVAPGENANSLIVTALSLFFLRIFLLGVNSKGALSGEDRASLIWAGFLWLSSMTGMHATTRRNLATSAIGSVFFVFAEGGTRPKVVHY
eukprot:GHVU01110233.1.p1 GENE.GHVU01110233.1~~GHVU01110233.1.p1  ORF type:complete len:248 (+),score=28.25 GHVU01110233.1:138-881(+)